MQLLSTALQTVPYRWRAGGQLYKLAHPCVPNTRRSSGHSLALAFAIHTRTMSLKLNDGTTIPFIAYGSGTALYGKDAAQSVVAAIKAGLRHIDAAQMYRNEDSVGEGIQQAGVPRSELYVTTKLASVPAGQTVKDTLKESLRKLKLDYVDLFLIHNPQEHKDLKATWKALEELKAEGLTKSIGLSNFQPQHIKQVLEVATVPPAVNQVSVLQQPFKWPLTDICRSSTTLTSSRRVRESSTCTRSTTSSQHPMVGSRLLSAPAERVNSIPSSRRSRNA